jgi:hypothetical protein
MAAGSHPLGDGIFILKKKERAEKKRARVHFTPDLKVGVFVTLRTPEIIRARANSLIAPASSS